MQQSVGSGEPCIGPAVVACPTGREQGTPLLPLTLAPDTARLARSAPGRPRPRLPGAGAPRHQLQRGPHVPLVGRSGAGSSTPAVHCTVSGASECRARNSLGSSPRMFTYEAAAIEPPRLITAFFLHDTHCSAPGNALTEPRPAPAALTAGRGFHTQGRCWQADKSSVNHAGSRGPWHAQPARLGGCCSMSQSPSACTRHHQARLVPPLAQPGYGLGTVHRHARLREPGGTSGAMGASENLSQQSCSVWLWMSGSKHVRSPHQVNVLQGRSRASSALPACAARL